MHVVHNAKMLFFCFVFFCLFVERRVLSLSSLFISITNYSKNAFPQENLSFKMRSFVYKIFQPVLYYNPFSPEFFIHNWLPLPSAVPYPLIYCGRGRHSLPHIRSILTKLNINIGEVPKIY